MQPERRQGLPAFRRGPRRKPKPTAVIWCEGESEQGYLSTLIAVLAKSHLVKLNPHGAGSHPRNLLDAAAKDASSKAADHVWLVFDDDNRQDFWPVVQRAQGIGYRVAWSSLCFEFWLLLHHQHTTATDHTPDQVAARLRRADPAYGKGLDNADWQDYVSKRAVAIANAQRVAAWQAPNAKPYPPGTTVHELVTWLEQY